MEVSILYEIHEHLVLLKKYMLPRISQETQIQTTLAYFPSTKSEEISLSIYPFQMRQVLTALLLLEAFFYIYKPNVPTVKIQK